MLHQPSAVNKHNVPSLYIFRHFLSRSADGTVDASRVHSKECYEMWLQRKNKTASPEEAKYFHRTLSSHVGGFDGRMGFTAEEEAAILLVLRQKRVWPCFEGTNLTHGARGYRALGMHEKIANSFAAPSATTDTLMNSPLSETNWPDYSEMMMDDDDTEFLLACQNLSRD